MSDWYGPYSTAESVKAGLDLETPGATALGGELDDKALSSGKLSYVELDNCIGGTLEFIKCLTALDMPQNTLETKLDNPQRSTNLRKVAVDSIVLSNNEGKLLPFNLKKRTAVTGTNAAIAAYYGGGSAALGLYYTIAPLASLADKCENKVYAIGASAWKTLPLLSEQTRIKDGKKGLDMTIYLEPAPHADRQAIHTRKSDTLLMNRKNP